MTRCNLKGPALLQTSSTILSPFPLFLSWIHFIDTSPSHPMKLPGIPVCPISGSISFFLSVLLLPHGVFYYLRYLIWEVSQQRHLHNKLSTAPQSRLRTQAWRVGSSGHHIDGKHTHPLTHAPMAHLRCLPGLLWRRPESGVRLPSGAEQRGGWRWWRSTRSASTSNLYFYTNLREDRAQKHINIINIYVICFCNL